MYGILRILRAVWDWEAGVNARGTVICADGGVRASSGVTVRWGRDAWGCRPKQFELVVFYSSDCLQWLARREAFSSDYALSTLAAQEYLNERFERVSKGPRSTALYADTTEYHIDRMERVWNEYVPSPLHSVIS